MCSLSSTQDNSISNTPGIKCFYHSTSSGSKLSKTRNITTFKPIRGTATSRGARSWEWLLEAPRVRLRTTRDRLLAQLGELAVLNERLAGNEARDARARIEFLQTRRRNWEQIFDYVTKQDVAATLAVIEEANKKVIPNLFTGFLMLSCQQGSGRSR
jgi:hypothetical protein